MRDSKIQSYRDLKVWQEAVNLAEICYRFTKIFPKEELYGMTTNGVWGVGCGVWGLRTLSTWDWINDAGERGSRSVSTYIFFSWWALLPPPQGFSSFPTPHTLPPTPFFRKTRGEYIQFLYIAQGSLKELETHLLISQRVELASSESINPILNQCESVGRLLLALIRALESK